MIESLIFVANIFAQALKLFLFTPPFTQLNTPYPATAYLKGFLETKHIESFQADLGIEVTLALFSSVGLKKSFAVALPDSASENARRIWNLQHEYIKTIGLAIGFLQGKYPNFAYQIAQRNYLPEAGRFATLTDLQWAFGSMGLGDQAKYIATLYLEDLADYIQECVDPYFGFSRYAERLGRCRNTFDDLYESLQNEMTFIDRLLCEQLEKHIHEQQPDLVCMSVPFPGNLYSAFRSAKFLKENYPGIQIAMGGGFPNTELRQLSDERVFSFFDFITLDDGEAPLMHLIEYLQGNRPIDMLKRTFVCTEGKVQYINNSPERDYKQTETGTPNYNDLLLSEYISAVEIINPMHKLWSDGLWLKLTMAHGCYWGKCTFCDISLDYIQRYEPSTAAMLCDRVEQLIAQTGERSFHFVDEAAPPSLMKAFAIEVIKRQLQINWWTNIRFEKNFTEDLCRLLKASGCIAVSGGLEVASDRLLILIEKGVSVEGVAKVASYFTQAGILVHAYLMYGFPGQTAQETIDSMEVVRQMFASGILRSAFWHQFAMTAHSPVGMNPEKYGVRKISDQIGSFANNDIDFEDLNGHDANRYAEGLRISLFNYMQSAGLEHPLHQWFDFKIPATRHPQNWVMDIISSEQFTNIRPATKVYWLQSIPEIICYTKSKKGQQWTMAELRFNLLSESYSLHVSEQQGMWLLQLLQKLLVTNSMALSFADVRADFENNLPDEDFELFWYNKVYKNLRVKGLIAV